MNPFDAFSPENVLKEMLNGVRDLMGWTMEWGNVGPGTASWAASIELASFWIGLTAFLVTVALGAVGIARGMLTNQYEDVWRAILGVAFAVPATLLTIWGVGKILPLLDYIPGMLNSLNGDKTPVEMLIAIYGLNEDSDMLMELLGGNMLAAFLNCVFLFFGFFTLGAMRIVRALGIMTMVAFAPFVFTMSPLREGADVRRNYAILLTGLLITDPVLLGTLWLLTRTAVLLEDPWSPNGLTVTVGLALLGLAPMAFLGMFAWAGADRDAGGHTTMRATERVGRGAARGAAAAGKVIVPAAGRGAAKAGKVIGQGAKSAASKTKSTLSRMTTASSTGGGGGKRNTNGSTSNPGPGSKPAQPGILPSGGGGKRGPGGGGQRPPAAPPSTPPTPGKK